MCSLKEEETAWLEELSEELHIPNLQCVENIRSGQYVIHLSLREKLKNCLVRMPLKLTK